MSTFQAFQLTLMALIGLVGTAVVLIRAPKRQVFWAGVYGLLQAILFYSLHSPDVALSELTVGTIALPALLLTTLAKLDQVP